MADSNIPVLDDDDERCALLGVEPRNLRGQPLKMAQPIIEKAKREKIAIQLGHYDGANKDEAADIHDNIDRIVGAAKSLIEYHRTLDKLTIFSNTYWPSDRKKNERASIANGFRRLSLQLHLSASYGPNFERLPKVIPAHTPTNAVNGFTQPHTPRPKPFIVAEPEAPTLVPNIGSYTELLEDLRKGRRLDEIAILVEAYPYLADMMIDPLLRRVANTPSTGYDAILTAAIESDPGILTADRMASFALNCLIMTQAASPRKSINEDFLRTMFMERPDIADEAKALIERGRQKHFELTNGYNGKTSTAYLKAEISKATGILLFQIEKLEQASSHPKRPRRAGIKQPRSKVLAAE